MPIALILIGAILVIVAFNNTMGDLARALQADIPGFFIWAAAIAVILGLGYVPGLKTPSRWLLVLVGLVILLTNYQKIFTGLTTFATTGGGSTGAGTPPANPASTFASSPTGPQPTAAQVSGDNAAAGAAGGAATGSAIGSAIGGLTGGGLGNIGAQISAIDNLSNSFGFGGFT
jgi:hypothetical protein